MGVPSGRNSFSTIGAAHDGKGGDAQTYHHDTLPITSEQRSESLCDPLFKVIAACGTTFVQILLRRHVQTSLEQTASIYDILFAEYPVCEPSALLASSTSVPSALRPYYSCDAFIMVNLCLIFSYWGLVIDLFWNDPGGRWRKQYMPWVFAVGPTGALLCHTVLRDSATLFLQVLPVCLNICMVGCLFHNMFVFLKSSGVVRNGKFRWDWGYYTLCGVLGRKHDC